MAPLATISTSVIFWTILIITFSFIEWPIDVVFRETLIALVLCISDNMVMHDEVPALEVCLGPGSGWILTHQMPKSVIIFCNVTPLIIGCSRINNMNILPYFTCTTWIGLGVNCCIHPECLFPVLYVINL